MKKLYWRPSKIPQKILLLIAILSIMAMASVETFKTNRRQPYFNKKIEAAQIMKNAMAKLMQYRKKYIGPIDLQVDPTGSGMIGLPSSLITSNVGFLNAKQTSVNPNWAAVMVHLLKKAKLEKGDTVAVSFSGSFPAINIATYAAIETLELHPICISSASASSWGANVPEFAWIDMERILFKNKIISTRSVACSLGGEDDRGLGMSKKSHRLLKAAIKRNDLRFIEVNSLAESIDARMEIYKEYAGEKKIKAYLNIGGSLVSVGSKKSKKMFNPGLNTSLPSGARRIDSLMSRFAKENVPVIHMVYLNHLADEYGLEKSPKVMPKIGIGHMYYKSGYNYYLAASSLVFIIVILFIFLKMDIGYRIFGSKKMAQEPKHPEPMV